MKLIMTINMDNTAFDPNPELEISRILRDLSEKVLNTDNIGWALFDHNGNRVGNAHSNQLTGVVCFEQQVTGQRGTTGLRSSQSRQQSAHRAGQIFRVACCNFINPFRR